MQRKIHQFTNQAIFQYFIGYAKDMALIGEIINRLLGATSSPRFLVGSLVLCVCLIVIDYTFSFDYCVVCSSSIYRF